MKHTGIYGAADGAHLFGFRDLTAVHWNLTAPRLYAEALVRGEARIADGGALVAETGAHTGRSPNDKFVVRDASTENHVWWDNNGAISPAEFETLLGDFSSTPRAATCSCRTSTPPPTRRRASTPASSPSSRGIRCSSAIF